MYLFQYKLSANSLSLRINENTRRRLQYQHGHIIRKGKGSDGEVQPEAHVPSRFVTFVFISLLLLKIRLICTYIFL